MVTSPFFTFKSQPYVGEITIFFWVKSPFFWPVMSRNAFCELKHPIFSRLIEDLGPMEAWSKTDGGPEVRRSEMTIRFQQHWSGWWWKEPWNFEWLSHDIGNGKSSQVTNTHIFQRGRRLKPPTSYTLNWILFGYINSVNLGFKLPENDVLFWHWSGGLTKEV